MTPLAGMTALIDLGLYNTKITDVAPLAGLTALIDLDLRRTWAITDVTPLNHLRCQIIR